MYGDPPSCGNPLCPRSGHTTTPDESSAGQSEGYNSGSPSSGNSVGSGETSSLAVASLVTGILGVTCNALVIPFIAIVCGHLAKKRIRASEGRLSGGVFASWGLALGYIGIVISLATVFALCYTIWFQNTLEEAIKNAPL
jgi:hypothetical protein